MSLRIWANCTGERPVTLLAYSLGSRLVHQTLLKLAERRAFDIVENVIFVGSPLPAQNTTSWRAIRSVVSGRVINCYAQDDWVLGFVYRGGSLEWGVAGLEEVNCILGIENYDVSGLVAGHLQYIVFHVQSWCRYRFVLGEILKQVGWEDYRSSGKGGRSWRGGVGTTGERRYRWQGHNFRIREEAYGWEKWYLGVFTWESGKYITDFFVYRSQYPASVDGTGGFGGNPQWNQISTEESVISLTMWLLYWYPI